MKIRRASLADTEILHELVNKYAGQGLMLPRPRSMLYENIRDFIVVETEKGIVGAGALHIMWKDLAEIRALAVREDMFKKGVGRKIVNCCLKEAEELGIPKVFTLTYQPGFFQKMGFVVVDKENMPQKVWKECIDCPKFPNCDEICMEYRL